MAYRRRTYRRAVFRPRRTYRRRRLQPRQGEWGPLPRNVKPKPNPKAKAKAKAQPRNNWQRRQAGYVPIMQEDDNPLAYDDDQRIADWEQRLTDIEVASQFPNHNRSNPLTVNQARFIREMREERRERESAQELGWRYFGHATAARRRR